MYVGFDLPVVFKSFRRLEAATSRLEDIALAQQGGVGPSTQLPPSEGQFSKGIEGGNTTEKSAPPEEPHSIRVFDEKVVKGKIEPWVQLSHTLGGPIDEQVHPSL